LKTRKETNSELIKYAGMGMQFLAGIGLGIFFGFKADEWLNISFPLLVWLLPLLIIISMTIKIIRDTSGKP
jgi:type IV secretory pathway TrbD component